MNNKLINIPNLILLLFLGLLSILLFIGGPPKYSPRSILSIWNLGHIILFWLFGIFVLKKIKRIKIYQFSKKLFILVVSAIIIGLIIEILQYGFNRTPDIADIWRNIIGVLIAIFFSNESENINKTYKIISKIVIGIFIFIEIFPVLINLYDEQMAGNNFPVLSDFESSLELERWTGDCPLEISQEFSINGKSSLKIDFNTTKYSGVSLDFFPPDWSNYRFIKFYIYNPSPDSLLIICRIHDEYHNNNFSDRFNQRLIAVQGWNEFKINLFEIKNAPKLRDMNIKRIRDFSIFVIELPISRTIYLDYLLLEQ